MTTPWRISAGAVRLDPGPRRQAEVTFTVRAAPAPGSLPCTFERA
ncbi:MAG: hypothetical protein ACRDQ7_23605 [Haloechinothrix sp.]